MSLLITNNMRLFSIEHFIESFTEENFNIYYCFIGAPLPFSDDNNPPEIQDNTQTVLVDSYDNMLYGRRVTANDVIRVVPRYDWVTGTVYTKYTHTATNLKDKAFYVVVDEGAAYNVFKCLDNNKGASSTIAPSLTETSAGDDFYFSADGYQWKYMYSITPANFDKFATADFIPVYPDANVVANAVNGGIENIEITSSGNNYIATSSGTFQEIATFGNPRSFSIDPSTASSNANFYNMSALKITAGVGAGQQRKITGYTVSGTVRVVTVETQFDVEPTTDSSYVISPLVTITGDGSGALARAVVNTTTKGIHSIEITDRGEFYTYASVTFSGNTGGLDGGAAATVIISPRGGHGSNAAAELGCHSICVSAKFDSGASDGKIIDENDFRVVGILSDPNFTRADLSISNNSGGFETGETITQYLGSPISEVVVVNPGSGYTSNAAIVIGGVSSNLATAFGIANSTGKIASVRVTDSGSGYLLPTITFGPPTAITFNANTNVNDTDEFITLANNVFQNNSIVTYRTSTGNTVISGLANNTSYYVVQANSTGIKLSSTLNGTAINLTKGLTQTGHNLIGETATGIATLNTNKQAVANGTVVSFSAGQLVLANVHGFFQQGNSTLGLVTGEASGYTAVVDSVSQPGTYFDQTVRLTGSLQTAQNFAEDELITQANGGNGYYYSSNNTVLRVVNKKGIISITDPDTSRFVLGDESDARFLVTNTAGPDIIDGSGNILYLENFSPITKTAGQTETIKLVLDF